MSRKVTFFINDLAWFRNDVTFHNPELSSAQIEDILDTFSNPFIAVYSLTGDSQPNHYDLAVQNGDELVKTSVNDETINGYRHMILNDCIRYYMGHEHSGNNMLKGYPKDVVFGCIEILEEEV